MSNFYRYTIGLPSFVSKEHLIQLLRRTKYKDNSVSIKVTESENRVVVTGRKKFIFPYGKEIFKIEYDKAEKTISVNISGSRLVELEQLLFDVGLPTLYFIFRYNWGFYIGGLASFNDINSAITISLDLYTDHDQGVPCFSGGVVMVPELLKLIKIPEKDLLDLAGMEVLYGVTDENGGSFCVALTDFYSYISVIYSEDSLSITCSPHPSLITDLFSLMSPDKIMINYTVK